MIGCFSLTLNRDGAGVGLPDYEHPVRHGSKRACRSWSYGRPYAPIAPGRSGCRNRRSANWSRRSAAKHRQTAHQPLTSRVWYEHHPFFGQDVEHVRVHHQQQDTVVVRLPDGLQLAIPRWMLDPAACRTITKEPVPRIVVEALIRLRQLLDVQVLLSPTEQTNPGSSPSLGGSDEQEVHSPRSAATETGL